MEKQYKSFSISTKEMQITDDGEFGYFKGYAITWDNIDRAREVAVKGCFAESLKDNPHVKMQWQHDYADLIGSYTKLEEDDTGLYCEGRINLATARGKEAYALLKAGDIDGLSIGYEVVEDHYDSLNNVRYLDKMNLYEISLVSVPCNPKAQVFDVKGDTVSIDDIKNCKGNVRDIERMIKGKPLSANAAKYFAGLAFRSEVESIKQKNRFRAEMDDLKSKMEKLKLGIKDNPYHDEQGRFTSAEGDTGGGNGGDKPKDTDGGKKVSAADVMGGSENGFKKIGSGTHYSFRDRDNWCQREHEYYYIPEPKKDYDFSKEKYARVEKDTFDRAFVDVRIYDGYKAVASERFDDGSNKQSNNMQNAIDYVEGRLYKKK